MLNENQITNQKCSATQQARITKFCLHFGILIPILKNNHKLARKFHRISYEVNLL